jgi:membrane-bound lytic murein transglycosylase B
MNALFGLKTGCLLTLALLVSVGVAAAGNDAGTPEAPISPFSKHEDRYRTIYRSLRQNGIPHARIMAIFSSDKAKQVDMTPVERMSERVIPPFRLRTEGEVEAIAQRIIAHLKRYGRYYDELENRFSVNREIAAAILYKETALGQFDNWQHTAFPVLNSIVGFMELPQEPMMRKRARRIVRTARKSLEELILYCEEYGIDVTQRDFPSSFAGAIGIPQFLPMYLDYALSGDGGVPDLSEMHDAILSLGNIFTNNFGWPGFMELDRLELIDGIIRQYKTFDQQKGVSFCMSEHLDGYPLRPFVVAFDHLPHIGTIGTYCKTIMQYNFSSSYTLDVFQFAYHTQRLMGSASAE